MKQKVILHDNVISHRKTFVKKPKSITNDLIKWIFILSSGIWLLVALSQKAFAVIEPYTNVFNLETYQIVERQGDCNLFVNGFNEELKICPEDLKEEEYETR